MRIAVSAPRSSEDQVIQILRTPAPARDEIPSISEEAMLVFAPLHKLAFGVAIGTATGLAIFLATAGHLLLNPTGAIDLMLLAEYFYGYEVSWRGALIGSAWGFGVGWVAGWFVAFCRNLVIASWFFLTRARAQLDYARSFLEHV